jgi:acyl carrier protein
MNSQIQEDLKEIYIQALRLHVAKNDVPETGLIERFGIDSIGAMELLITIESRYNIQFEAELLSGKILDSLDTLATYVEQRLSTASSLGAQTNAA